MSDDFSNFVSIQLSKDKKNALYVQLYDALLHLIQDGHLSPGYALPPVRKFAGFLGINAGTVVSAYRELEKNGWIYSRTGSGSYVAEPPETIDKEREDTIPALEIHDPEFLTGTQSSDAINMSSISLNPDIVSVEQFKQLILRVLDRDQGHAFGYQESQGFLPLRESIARYLAQSGIHTSAENLQIISGAQQGIDIVARAILQHGDYVFTEAPTYPGAIAAFRARGAKLIDIPLEADGPDLALLENRLRKFQPRLIYCMPNLQNPTGITWSLEKRARLMGLARYYNAYVLEDDYISELSYREEPLAPLKAMDRDDRIIYLKSFSKIFMPGLRLAFLNMPERLAPRLLQVKHLADISTSGLTQRVFDLYLRQGIWQKHIQAIRRIYSTQFDFTCRLADEHLPVSVQWQNPRGGLSLWLQLPHTMDAAAVTEAARQQNLLITDGTDFYPRPTDRHHIRISFATLSLQQIEAGLRILGTILSSSTAPDSTSDNQKSSRI